MICLTTLVAPPHTLTLSLSHFLSGPECQRCQGASVCSVTTVIVKQRAHGGPLLRYSQKEVELG